MEHHPYLGIELDNKLLEAATGKCKIKGHTYSKLYGQKELYKTNKIRHNEPDLHKSCPPSVGTWKLSVGPLPTGSNPADRGCAEQSGTIRPPGLAEALGWLPLQNRRLVNRLTFMHKTIYTWTTWVYATTLCKPANTTE